MGIIQTGDVCLEGLSAVIMGCDAVQSGRNLQTFLWNVIPESSGPGSGPTSRGCSRTGCEGEHMDLRKLHNEELHNLCSSPNEVKHSYFSSRIMSSGPEVQKWLLVRVPFIRPKETTGWPLSDIQKTSKHEPSPGVCKHYSRKARSGVSRVLAALQEK
jgi:hypothetical protein